MKTLIQRVPFGKGRFEPIRAVRFLEGEQEFEVEFDSGGIGLLPNADLRRANGLLPKSTTVDSIWIDGETQSGFFVRYGDGTTAEASWELVLENPPFRRPVAGP